MGNLNRRSFLRRTAVAAIAVPAVLEGLAKDAPERRAQPIEFNPTRHTDKKGRIVGIEGRDSKGYFASSHDPVTGKTIREVRFSNAEYVVDGRINADYKVLT